MIRIQNTPVATVRDLITLFEEVATKYGDNVIPYFWNDVGDKEFVLAEPIDRVEVDMKISQDFNFVALETFDPDPDNERAVPLSSLIRR